MKDDTASYIRATATPEGSKLCRVRVRLWDAANYGFRIRTNGKASMDDYGASSRCRIRMASGDTSIVYPCNA